MLDKCTSTKIISYYPHSNIPREDIILIVHMETGSKRLNGLSDDKWKVMTSKYSSYWSAVLSTLCGFPIYETEKNQQEKNPAKQTRSTFILYTVIFYMGLKVIKTIIISLFQSNYICRPPLTLHPMELYFWEDH